MSDGKVAAIRAYCFQHSENKLKRRTLDDLRERAAGTGGVLTLDLQSLEDGTLEIKVPPDMLIPYIDNQIIETDRALAASELVLSKIHALINGETK